MFRFTLTFILFSIHNCFSQEANIPTTPLVEAYSLFSFDLSDKTIKGTPYIIDKFSLAKISTSEEETFNFRYNAVNDEMEIKLEEEEIFIINKRSCDFFITFIKSNRTYQIFIFLSKDGNSELGYFSYVLDKKSTIKLLRKESKKFIDRKPALNSYQKAKPAHFKRQKNVFYIKRGDKDIVEKLPKSKKGFANLFPAFKKEILSIIKKEKIKLSEEADLIKLVTFINTLKST